MDFEKKVDSLFNRKDRAVSRNIIWHKISQFAIDPPELFYAQAVSHTMHSEGNPVAGQEILHELRILNRLYMVHRLPPEPEPRVVWHTRIDQERWDFAEPFILASLNP